MTKDTSEPVTEDAKATAGRIVDAVFEFVGYDSYNEEVWLDRRKAVEAVSAALLVAHERLTEELAWRAGSGSRLSKLLREVVIWTQCDRAQNGPGPAGGYDQREADATEALTLWLTAEAAHERLQQQAKELKAYAQHKSGCTYQLSGGQLVHNSMAQREIHVPECTCGLDALRQPVKDLEQARLRAGG